MGAAAYFRSSRRLLHSLEQEKIKKFSPFNVEGCCRLERCASLRVDFIE